MTPTNTANAYHDIIRPHEGELLENRKQNKKRFAQALFTKEYRINPKSNPAVGDLAHDVDIAIEQEKHLNQDVGRCLEMLTCNVGQAIETIKNDRLEL